MTQQHPIIPSPGLVNQWIKEANHNEPMFAQIAAIAARWGADQELDTCCQWLAQETPDSYISALRAYRRPKLKSLKEQALGALYTVAIGTDDTKEFTQGIETIKQALESLPD